MSTASPRRMTTEPLLHEGQRLHQEEFHRRYEACPKHCRFELIGGVVRMPSPLRIPHGEKHSELDLVLGYYKTFTPGVQCMNNASAILGESSEPQPDLALRIRPDWGGQSGTTPTKYVQGPPELLAEIADSSRDIDMKAKRIDYQQAGVVEYLVWCIAERELHWFDFSSDEEIKKNRKGIYRSRVFPGLWIDGEALMNLESQRSIAVLNQGLASREHAAFVRRLEKAWRKLSSPGNRGG